MYLLPIVGALLLSDIPFSRSTAVLGFHYLTERTESGPNWPDFSFMGPLVHGSRWGGILTVLEPERGAAADEVAQAQSVRFRS
jgi:hypothetical protein